MEAGGTIMEHKLKMISGLLFFVLFAFTMPTYGADDVTRISADQLKERLGSSGLVLLDARTARDWDKSDRKIVGAVRVNPQSVGTWAGNYSKDQNIVLYCA
jgi:hypothetical protein